MTTDELVQELLYGNPEIKPEINEYVFQYINSHIVRLTARYGRKQAVIMLAGVSAMLQIIASNGAPTDLQEIAHGEVE